MAELNKYKDSEEHGGYDHILKYTGLFGGVQGIKILSGVVRNKLSALILHPSGTGLNAIYQNIGEIANNATNMGISFSSVRHVSEIFENGTEEEMNHFVRLVRTWCLWTAILGGGLTLLLSPLLSFLFFEDNYATTTLKDYLLFDKGLTHTLNICVLAIFVAATSIGEGECSILKGVRKLKRLSMIETFSALATLFLTIPFYFLWGVKGITFALSATAVASMVLHLWVSTKIFPWRVSPLSKSFVKEGLPMLRIGVPYIMVHFLTALSMGLVFQLIGDNEQVGLYRMGYGMLCYTGMVFVALEADFFPRLSSVNKSADKMNKLINQQIDVCVLLMTPLLIGFILIMPWAIRLLSSDEFVKVLPMTVLSVFYMFFRCVANPVAYMALARGETLVFLFMEVVYDGVMIVLFYVGLHEWGLPGAGIALSLISLFDAFWVGCVYSWLYGYRMPMRTLRLVVAEFVCVAAVVPFCLHGGQTLIKYSIGGVALGLSVYLAWHFLSRESQFLHKVLHKFKHSSSCDC